MDSRFANAPNPPYTAADVVQLRTIFESGIHWCATNRIRSLADWTRALSYLWSFPGWAHRLIAADVPADQRASFRQVLDGHLDASAGALAQTAATLGLDGSAIVASAQLCREFCWRDPAGLSMAATWPDCFSTDDADERRIVAEASRVIDRVTATLAVREKLGPAVWQAAGADRAGPDGGGAKTEHGTPNGVDREFMERAVEEARKSPTEDGRVHPNPKVGVVVVKDGKELAVAYRGEQKKGEHAEFTVLEKKLADVEIAGATVYTTLEPCTTRNHPKRPCALRLVDRKVKRVVIGMLDPNPKISGRGQRKLREANIEIGVFPPDLMAKIEEMNREFIKHYGERGEEVVAVLEVSGDYRIQFHVAGDVVAVEKIGHRDGFYGE